MFYQLEYFDSWHQDLSPRVYKVEIQFIFDYVALNPRKLPTKCDRNMEAGVMKLKSSKLDSMRSRLPGWLITGVMLEAEASCGSTMFLREAGMNCTCKLAMSCVAAPGW